MLRRRSSNATEKEQSQKKRLTLQRSSSFKDFMKHKPTAPSEKEFNLEHNVVEGVPTEEAVKSGSKLGKKWRNVISRTMTRKTSKMVQKALAEEGDESGEDLSPVSPDWLTAGQRTSVSSTGSEETTSPTIRGSDRRSLDSGYSQRDSVRLEENAVSYNGPFCGRAMVHTDFTPSPYDLESLKLQKGDIIYIIEKTPVGTWTGKLNNKVGSFKFIYVNLLPEECPPSRRRHRRRSRTCEGKSKPKTLEEVLDSIGLRDLGSLLSMHGFQSLEDFAVLKASHLNELNITDPEERSKILKASELLLDCQGEAEVEGQGGAEAEEKADCEAESQGEAEGKGEAEDEGEAAGKADVTAEAEGESETEGEGLSANRMNGKVFIKKGICLSSAAEDESEPEERFAEEPRDSGCFESSENLKSGREEPQTEENFQNEENRNQKLEQLDAVKEHLQELMINEGS